MQRLEVSGTVRLIYMSLGVKGLIQKISEHKICGLIFSTLFYKTLLILKSSGR